jgi:phenylpropionate dioxygenase-like ring-hydroxylating dioxygenase large terminal subunit
MNDLSSPPTATEIHIAAEEFRGEEWDRLEREKLWPRVWQIACRETELPQVGDFVAYEILDESILIVRTGKEPDDLSAFYNVCQHRGRRLRDEPRGRIVGSITCPFHGWKYSNTGELTSVFMEEDWADCPSFSKESLSIPKVQVARWGGWVWINQDPAAESLREWLGDVADRLDCFQFENARPLWWKTIIAPVNWKVIVEAFNEGYHSGATHISGVDYRNLRSPTAVVGNHAMFYSEPGGLSRYKTDGGWVEAKSLAENLWANNLHLYRTLGALTLAPGMTANERLLELPEDTSPEAVIAKYFEFHREELEKNGVIWPEGLTLQSWLAAGTDWTLFPNSVALPTVDGALWYRMRPHRTDRDKCVFDIWSFGRFAPGQEPKVEQEIYEGFEAFRGQCSFLEEDFENMEAVNLGTKSRGFRGATINPLQEGTVGHVHDMLRRFLIAP